MEFDPHQVSYDELLKVFNHDPTTPNRQGPDIGTQYRSVIFFHDAKQQAAAKASRAALSERSKKRIVTEVTQASQFYPAEEYHQRYLEKRGLATCHIGLASEKSASGSG